MKKNVMLHNIRGIAALMVMFGHLVIMPPGGVPDAGLYLGVGNEEVLPGLLSQGWTLHHFLKHKIKLYYLGSIGVSLFFLLSGYLISMSVRRNYRPGTFFWSRFYRIYPTLWLSMLILLFLGLAISHSTQAVWPHETWGVTLNFFNIHSFFGAQPFNPVIWSLLIEELFYLTVLVQLLVFKNLNLKGTICACLVFTSIVTIRYLIFDFLGFRSPALDSLSYSSVFLPFLYVGVSLEMFEFRSKQLANLSRTESLTKFCFVFFLFGIFLMNAKIFNLVDGTLEGSSFMWRGYLFSLFLFLALLKLKDTPVENWALNFLGNISYPLYLVHTSVGLGVIYFLSRYSQSLYLSISVAFATSVFVAYLIHISIEKRSLVWSKNAKGRDRLK